MKRINVSMIINGKIDRSIILYLEKSAYFFCIVLINV